LNFLISSFLLNKSNIMKKYRRVILLAVVLFSCQKEISHEVVSTEVDVYVAGMENNGSGVGVAKYWKNGQAIELTDGTKEAGANSIVVVGSDVYAAGSEVIANRSGVIARYWKNGSPVNLTDGSTWANANSIGVSGNDVYVAGTIVAVTDGNIHAVYWKNGNPTFLPENTDPKPITDPVSSKESLANSIFVSGSDVYIAGQEIVTGGPNYSLLSALYWKNGNAVYLLRGEINNSANSIFVVGHDVYACGALDARYWKNGNAVPLPGTAKSIFVSDGDVYVAGSQPDGEPFQTYFGTRYRTVAKYWKNGIPVKLSDGTKDAYATSIAVSGNDVYVAGYEENTAGANDYVAKYWKNGDPVILGDVSKYSEAYSIFLAKK
jgi:hypothetical protein